MLENFYGLTGKPFQLTPDPDFYFRSVTHRKALSYLGYGLAQGEGFIVITGEIGAGKSTLVAHTIRSLDANQVTVAQVVTSRLDGDEIIHVVARAFGLPIDGHDKAAALSEIEAFLHEEAREGRRCLLVVDESQNLAVQALEELRMLSNFQLGSHPLLQVLLLGQPEFRATLQQDPGLEQMRQRIIAAHHLEAMQASEIEPYLVHRLEQVGWAGNPAFDQRVFSEMFDASGGIPRKINQIANRLLLLGAVEQRSRIDAVLLQHVLAEMGSESAFPVAPPSPMATDPQAAPAQAAIAPVASADTGIDPQLIDDLLAERDIQIAELRQAVAALAAHHENDATQDDDKAALNEQAMHEQIAEMQQAIVELSTQQDEAATQALAPEIEGLREQIAKLEARTFEQERTIRHTLTMLIEWIESEMDTSKAA